MPDFVKSLAFWEAASLVIGVLVAFFTDYKLEAAVVLGLVLSVLKLFGVNPELRARGIK